MKRILVAATLALASLASFAQQTLNSGLDNQNVAGASNMGVSNSLSLNSFGAPVTLGMLSSSQDVHTNQSWGVASSFATAAVWRCATSGWGAAAQAVGGGISIAGKGGESVLCAGGYKAGLVAETEKLPITGVTYIVVKSILCQDDDIANGYEKTDRKCEEPVTTEQRKQRWADERKARQAMSEVEPVAPVATTRPMPWQAGG